MTKFKGMKKLDEVCKAMESKAMEVDSTEFDEGGDWYYFKGGWNHLPLTIAYNTCNGKFIVSNGFTGKKMATESSEELETEEWYTDLLNTLYVV